MKKHRLLFLALVWATSTLVVKAQFGIEAGLTFNQLEDAKINNIDQSFENAQGKHIGVFYGLGKKRLNLRLGLRYTDTAGLYKNVVANTPDGFKASFIEIPVDLRLRVRTPLIKPYLVAGPVLRVAASSSDEAFKDAMKDLTVAATVGGGLELRLGGLSFYPELNYTTGVSQFLKEGATVGGVNFQAEQSKINQFVLKVGIGFH